MSKVFCIGELLIDFIGKDIGKGLKNGVNFEKKAGEHQQMLEQQFVSLEENLIFRTSW